MQDVPAPPPRLLLIGAAEQAWPLAQGMAATHRAEVSALAPREAVCDRADARAIAIELTLRRRGGDDGTDTATRTRVPVGTSLAEAERDLILRTLMRCNGNRTAAADVLGISVRTMRNKLRLFLEEGLPVTAAPSQPREGRA